MSALENEFQPDFLPEPVTVRHIGNVVYLRRNPEVAIRPDTNSIRDLGTLALLKSLREPDTKPQK